jgi:hypothetical protein
MHQKKTDITVDKPTKEFKSRHSENKYALKFATNNTTAEK